MPAWMLPCPYHDDNRLDLWTCKPAPINVVLIRVALVMVSVHSSKTLTKIQIQCDGLDMLGPESGTIVRCDLVGVGMSLWAWALRPSS